MARLPRLLVFGLLLSGCPAERASDPPPLPTATISAHPGADQPSESPPAASAIPAAATGTKTLATFFGPCPRWTSLKACRRGESVLAVGEIGGVQNEALARSTAENRALARALGGSGQVHGARTLGFKRCGPLLYAAVEIPAEARADADRLPPCDDAIELP